MKASKFHDCVARLKETHGDVKVVAAYVSSKTRLSMEEEIDNTTRYPANLPAIKELAYYFLGDCIKIIEDRRLSDSDIYLEYVKAVHFTVEE